MYDPWVTREITVRDLLVHRSGLGRGQGDLMFVPSTDISRADLVRRIRYLKPATSFRSGFAYDNVLYAVAGQVVEAVSGKTWEDFVEERILAPAGMKSAVTNDVDRLSRANRAYPHGRVGELRGVGEQQLFDEKKVALGANVGPAGAIAAGANDLARWLLVQLAAGQLPGTEQRIFSADERRGNVAARGAAAGDAAAARPRGRHAAVSRLCARLDRAGLPRPQDRAARGRHAGLPRHRRADPGEERRLRDRQQFRGQRVRAGPALYELLDHYLGLPKHDWPKAFKDLFEARNAAGLEAQRKAEADRPKSSPSLPLAGYAGDYADPWYGPIAITESDGALTIDFRQTPGMVAPLEHWAYDTFVARWPDPADRAGLRHLRAGCRRQARAHHDEGVLARRGFQLRLPRPRDHARCAEARRRQLTRIKKGPAHRAGPFQSSPLAYCGGRTAQDSAVEPGCSLALRRSSET